MQNHFKKAGEKNIKQALKCFRNARTGRRARQGDKWLGFGSRNAKKQA